MTSSEHNNINMNTTQPTDILGRIFRMTAADIHLPSIGTAGRVSSGDLVLCFESGFDESGREGRWYGFRRLDVGNDSIRCLSGRFVLWGVPSNMMEWKPSEFDLSRLALGKELKFGQAEMAKVLKMLCVKTQDDLHAMISEACRQRGWTDDAAFIAWKMGVVALESARQLGAKFPSDT